MRLYDTILPVYLYNLTHTSPINSTINQEVASHIHSTNQFDYTTRILEELIQS
jgi:hypothetical protein